ncbi:MAG: S8/S53 family peptidase [Candidatus Zixiibacteriota bacterium]
MMSDKNTRFSSPMFLLAGFSIVLLLSLSCSKSTGPDTNKPPDSGPIGVLLSGVDTDPALSGTSDHGPFAVPANEWNGDFATTRLEAVINPNASVGAVNTALNAVGAKISCMRAGLMFIELVVPAQASVNQAKMVCSTLVASSAFLSAYAAFDPIATNGASEFPDYPAKTLLGHLELPGFPASWNARQLLETNSSPATVLVVDDFLERVTHPEIPSQTFPGGAGLPNLGMDIVPGGTEWDGNHGFKVAGVIGATLDSLGSTGAFPGRSSLLRLPCILTHGFGTWPAFLADIATQLPLSGNFALNTSIGYPDTDFGVNSKLRRIEHALFWRALVLGAQDRCLHATSAGNQGVASFDSSNAVYNSPFAMSAKFTDPISMLHGTSVSSQDTANLNAMFSLMTLADARMGAITRNLLIVGASDWSGAPWTSSNSPSDVRMVGTEVVTTCAEADLSCSPGGGVPLQATASGTSFSTPQIAGLAAYLWGLSPYLTATEVKNLMLNCYNGKWVNAYQAVLALDQSLSNAQVRLAILDIADNNGQIGNNNKFDERDLQMYIDSILIYEADRALNVPPWEKDHSVFDLNGDGYTGNLPGAESTAPFDLDISTPPSYSTVQPPLCSDSTFDEMALTDRQILYYYAHSSMFSGDTAVRNALIPCRDTTEDTTYFAALSGKWKVTVGFNCDSSLNPSGSAFGEADLNFAADGTFSGSIALTNSVSTGCGLIRTPPLTGTVHGDLGNITGNWTTMSDSFRMSLTLHCPVPCSEPCNSSHISSNGVGPFRFSLTDSTGSMWAPLAGSYARVCFGIVPYITGCRFYRDGTFAPIGYKHESEIDTHE